MADKLITGLLFDRTNSEGRRSELGFRTIIADYYSHRKRVRAFASKGRCFSVSKILLTNSGVVLSQTEEMGDYRA